MNTTLTSDIHSRAASRADDSLLGRVLFVVLFASLLPVAFLAAMTNWRWQPWPPGNQGYRTFFREAKIAASTAAAMAFSF